MTAAQPSLPHNELRRVQLNTALLELCHAVSSHDYLSDEGQEAFKKASDQVYALILAQRQEAVRDALESLSREPQMHGDWQAVIEQRLTALQTYLEGEVKS